MSLKLTELFFDTKGNVKKGNALLIPLITLCCGIIYLASSSAWSYAQEYKVERDLVEKAFTKEHMAINKSMAELKTKVDNKVPLTKVDVQEQLDNFATDQKQLYQEQLTSQATVQAVQQKANRELVRGWLDISQQQQNTIQQTQLQNSKELGGLATSVNTQKDLVKQMTELASKDREAMKVLSQNNNTQLRVQEQFNENTAKELSEVLRQLQLISQKLEKDL